MALFDLVAWDVVLSLLSIGMTDWEALVQVHTPLDFVGRGIEITSLSLKGGIVWLVAAAGAGTGATALGLWGGTAGSAPDTAG